jgi:hypothetical protein
MSPTELGPSSQPYGWVCRNGHSWVPVTLTEWIEAERGAGFHAPAGVPATAGFSGLNGVRGQRRKPKEVILQEVDELLQGPEIGVRRERPLS